MKLPIITPVQKILSVTLLFLIIVQLWQWNSTQFVRETNKQLIKENKALTTLNLQISKKLQADSIVVIKHQKKIDSLLRIDSVQKIALIKINSKYEKIRNHYHTLTPIGKTDYFTKLINN